MNESTSDQMSDQMNEWMNKTDQQCCHRSDAQNTVHAECTSAALQVKLDTAMCVTAATPMSLLLPSQLCF